MSWGVAFPDIVFAEKDPEWDPLEVIFDQSDKSAPFSDYPERLERYFRQRLTDTGKTPAAQAQSCKDRENRGLSPGRLRSRSLHKGALAESRSELVRLSSQQFRLLDMALNDGNPRILCDGGRGVLRRRVLDGTGSAGRIDKLLNEHRLSFPTLVTEDGAAPPAASLRAPGGDRRGAARTRCILPAAQAGAPGRSGPDRPASHAPGGAATQARRPTVLRGPEGRRLRRAPRARRRPLRRHGHTRHGRRSNGTTCCSSTAGRQALRPHRPDRLDPPLHRRRDAHAQQDGRRRLRAHQVEGPLRGRGDRRRSWSCCTERRVSTPGHAFGPDTRGSARWSRPSRSRRRRTSSRRSPR